MTEISWIEILLAGLYNPEGRDLRRLGFALCQFRLDSCPPAANDDQ